MLNRSNRYLRSLTAAEKNGLAQRCGITRAYLYNIIYSGKHPSVQLACKIERVTNGKVNRRALRPDIDWNLIEGTDVCKD